jgi:hypothetical protein
LPKVRQMLGAKGRIGPELIDSSERTPLLCAVFAKNEQLVAFLIERGADPNQMGRCPEQNCGGHPALPLATYLKQPKIVARLIAAKADVSWGDHRATRMANQNRLVEIYRMLKAAEGKDTKGEVGDAGLRNAPAGDDNGMATARLGVSELVQTGTRPLAVKEGRMKLAILADGSLQSAADLLAAEMKDFDLVERAEMDRVMAEQNLSASNDKGLQIGALVAADALLVIKPVRVGKESLAELRLIRVTPGIVMDTAYAKLSDAGDEARIRELAQRFTAQTSRLRTAKGVALSMGQFRPAANNLAAVSLARDASMLVSDRMLHAPEVVLLERGALADMVREQSVAGKGEFWQGAYLVDGTAEMGTGQGADCVITIRLQPAAGGKDLAFSARGPRSGVPALVDDVVKKSLQALSLSAPTQADPAAEARRYYAESKAAFAVGLYMTAFRYAESAALLGLNDPDFSDWRLQANLTALAWQAITLSNKGKDEMLFGQWSDPAMSKALGSADWMDQQTWLEAARTIVTLWRAQVRDAFASGGEDKIAAAMRYLDLVSTNVTGAWAVRCTAAGLIDSPEQIDAVRRDLQVGLDEAIALASAKPEFGGTLIGLLRTKTRILPLLTPTLKERTSAIASVLSAKYPADAPDAAGTRGLLLGMMIHYDNFESIQFSLGLNNNLMTATVGRAPIEWSEESVRALGEYLKTSNVPEDFFARQAILIRQSQSTAQRVAAGEQLFSLMSRAEKLVVAQPQLLRVFDRVLEVAARSGRELPRYRVTVENGQTHYTPEIAALRRKLFVAVARSSNRPELAQGWSDEHHVLPGDNAQELQELRQKVREASNAAVMQKSTRRTEAAAPKPKRNLATTPSYEKHEPLPVEICSLQEQLGHSYAHWRIFPGSIGVGEKELWLYAEPPSGYQSDQFQAAVIRVELPGLKPEVWRIEGVPTAELPKTGAMDAYITVEGDQVIVTRYGSFIAIGDRRSRSWQVDTEIPPASRVVRYGDPFYLLTNDNGVRGLMRYDAVKRSGEMIASTRRVPTKTPLDDPGVEANSLFINDDGRLAFNLYKAEVATVGRDTAPPAPRQILGTVTYDKDANEWSAIQPPEKSSSGTMAMSALTKPGWGRMYQKNLKLPVWTMQLARQQSPKVRVPLSLAPQPAAADGNAPLPIVGMQLFWTGEGYVLFQNGYHNGFWHLPADRLNAYLDAHEPIEDETAGVPPKTSASLR